MVVVTSLKTGVHIKGEGFHALTLHPTIGSSNGGNGMQPYLSLFLQGLGATLSHLPLMPPPPLESWQFCLCTEMLVFEP